MKVLGSILLCCFVAYGAEALSSGAPTSACDEMRPLHGPDPQPLPAPYTVTATPIDASRYTVTIQADSGTTFRGFFIQARSNLTNTAVGNFDTTADAQSVECNSTPMSASTHVSKDEKTSVSVVWNAPSSGEGVTFVATVVQTFNTFWVQIPATIV